MLMISKPSFALLAAVSLFALQLSAAEPQSTEAQSAQPQVIDGVAAVVNGDVITFSQVQELSGPRERTLREQYNGAELIDKIKEARLSALNDLIDRQLIVQEFKKKEYTMPEYVVDDQIQSIIKEEFGGDRQAFLRTLIAQGYTLSRFREMQRDKVIVGAMRQNNVKGNYDPTPQEVQAYYDANKQEFVTPEQLKLRMIVLNADPLDANSADSTGKTAEEIRDKVKGGADFATMAKTYSMDGTAASGGDWGLIDRKTLNQQLTDVAFALSPGQVSDVVRIGDSFYILYCESKKSSGIIPLQEVRDGINRKLQQAQRQKATQRWIDTLREKAYIKIY
jgi:peptidyl-prolyl cis-trans isomerase SurA